MPTYEYWCPVCDASFECVQHFSDPPLTTCPEGHTGVQRIYSPPTIVFKGSGFYTTDYGNAQTHTSRPSNKATKETAKPQEGDETKGDVSKNGAA
jgi:putative FmdB family regulatory protein